jgi:FixJ family two-component response regulator
MTPSTPIVFVVDDDSSVRSALELLIDSAGWRPVTFASAPEFLAYPRAVAPSCLVLDVTLPGLNGLELQARVAVDRIDLPIIFITGYGDVPMTVRAMKAGALEFLTKPFDDDVLLRAIRHGIERSRAALSRQAQIQTLRDCHASLSNRERQVMALVASGLLNKQVAGELGISEITVKAHRGRMMRKMEARSLADLVNIAAMLGLESSPRTRYSTDRRSASASSPFAYASTTRDAAPSVRQSPDTCGANRIDSGVPANRQALSLRGNVVVEDRCVGGLASAS